MIHGGLLGSEYIQAKGLIFSLVSEEVPMALSSRDLLFSLAQQSSERYAAYQLELAARGSVPQLGDVLWMPGVELPDDAIICLAVIKRHPKDESLVAVVPCDGITELVGTSDISIPLTRPFGGLVLRLGQLFWVHECHLAHAERWGHVEDAYLDKTDFVLHSIASGEWKGLPRQRQTDSMPEYREVLEQARKFCAQLL